MTMLSGADLLVLKHTIYTIVAAHLLHEATHWWFAWVFGRRPQIGASLSAGFYVDHDAGARITAEDWAIHGAPVAVGLVVAVGWIAAGHGIPVWLAAGWFVYTVMGAPNDLRFRTIAYDTPDWWAEFRSKH